MNVTFVIITKNRSKSIKQLINSILKARLDAFSLILIDDSNRSNFLQTKQFLQSLSIPFKQLSSLEAGRLVKKTLEKAILAPDKKNFIRNCMGLRSPFCDYAERFFERGELKLGPTNLGLWFAPYSSARNLGIYCAMRFFNPDSIFFLDDDCLIIHPEKLRSQIQLTQTKLDQKKIVAVSGLYKDLLPYKQPKTSEQRISKKALEILRGMDAFLRKCFVVRKERFQIMPPHMLGGALILSRKAFHILPFDPYVPRGEDHAYALDLKSFLDKNEIVIRDNHFIVGHQRENSSKHEYINVLRDIFRFVYSHAKTGCSFIPLFMVRWTITSLINLVLNPSNYKHCKSELWALLFIAPKFAKENARKFRQNIRAWKSFLDQSKVLLGNL